LPHFYIFKYVKKKDNKIFKLNDETFNKYYDLEIEIPSDYQERMEKNYGKHFNFLDINYYKENDERNFSPKKSPLNTLITDRRKDIFRNILYFIIKDYHDKFLRKKRIGIRFDPMKQKTWHHEFDPDKECKDIPLFEIPPPPEYISSFESVIAKNDLKNELIKYGLTNLKENLSKRKNQTTVKLSKNNYYNKYVSQCFLEKIRVKQEANDMLNKIQNYNLYYNSQNDMSKIYKEILLQLKTLLLVNKNIHKLKDVADLVLDSSRLIKDSIKESGKMMEIIKKLGKKYREFFKIINHSSLGPVVVLVNKNYEIPKNIYLE